MTTITETKQFLYEKQSYKGDFVKNVNGYFESLHQRVNFVEVLNEHHNKNKYNFPVQDTKKH